MRKGQVKVCDRDINETEPAAGPEAWRIPFRSDCLVHAASWMLGGYLWRLCAAVTGLALLVLAAPSTRWRTACFRANPDRWERAGKAHGAFVEFRCTACGTEAYSHTGKAPTDCKRGLNGGL